MHNRCTSIYTYTEKEARKVIKRFLLLGNLLESLSEKWNLLERSAYDALNLQTNENLGQRIQLIARCVTTVEDIQKMEISTIVEKAVHNRLLQIQKQFDETFMNNKQAEVFLYSFKINLFFYLKKVTKKYFTFFQKI